MGIYVVTGDGNDRPMAPNEILAVGTGIVSEGKMGIVTDDAEYASCMDCMLGNSLDCTEFACTLDERDYGDGVFVREMPLDK